MPRLLPHLLAALLGVGAALLAACGSGTTAGIPPASAEDLKSQIVDVRQAVEAGRCSDVPGQLRQVDEGIDDLPASTDEQLVANLRDGADTLRRVASEECDSTPTETTETETTEAPPQTTATEPPPQTETTPPQTTTTPQPTTTPPPTAPPTAPEPEPEPEPQQPPDGTPGGGTRPEVP